MILSVTSSFSVRAPIADLPNTAALLGALVAQEVIKVITKHSFIPFGLTTAKILHEYIPVNGYCVIDMIDMSTSIL